MCQGRPVSLAGAPIRSTGAGVVLGHLVEDGQALDRVMQRPGAEDLVQSLAGELLRRPAQQLLDRGADPFDGPVLADDAEGVDRGVGQGAEDLGRGLAGLDQLDAVAEGIVHVDPPAPVDVLGGADIDPGGRDLCQQRIQVVDLERRVGLAGGLERVLDTEVQLNRAASEPAAAPGRQLRRLAYPFESEEGAIEPVRLLLGPGALRHRELHVVDAEVRGTDLVVPGWRHPRIMTPSSR
jgi:hypothetical protein